MLMTPKKTFNIFYLLDKTFFCRTKYPFSCRGPAWRVFIVHVFLNTGFWDWAANNHGIAGVE
jgi:hypothetical protein